MRQSTLLYLRVIGEVLTEEGPVFHRYGGTKVDFGLEDWTVALVETFVLVFLLSYRVIIFYCSRKSFLPNVIFICHINISVLGSSRSFNPVRPTGQYKEFSWELQFRGRGKG